MNIRRGATDTDQRAIAALQDAAVDLAHTCRISGDHDTAQWAIDRGLLLLDPHEPLYLEWARLEQARGRRDESPTIWRRLHAQYAADVDEDATLIDTPPRRPSSSSERCRAREQLDRNRPAVSTGEVPAHSRCVNFRVVAVGERELVDDPSVGGPQ